MYNDNVNDPRIRKWLGQVVGNDETDLSRHDKWLCMMYPRIKLIEKLMSENGVIFISIDENEVNNLKLLCDEIFGIHNFLIEMPRVTKKSGKDHSSSFGKNHDFILAYSKDKSNILFNNSEVDENDYPYKDEYYNERGGYKLNQTLDYDSLWYNPKMDFVIKDSDGNEYYPGGSFEEHLERHNGIHNPKDWVWRWSIKKFNFGYKNGFVVIKDGKDRKRIYTKTYAKAQISKNGTKYFVESRERTSNVSSLEFVDNIYSNDNGKKEMAKLFGDSPFDFPKPSVLIRTLIKLATKSNSIVLDCFAGSGTTGQAVMELNKEDCGDRKFIEIEMADYANTITAERVKKIIEGYSNVDGIGGSFSYYELGDVLFDEKNNISPLIELKDLRQYIYFTETKQEITQSNGNEYYLGTNNTVDYYFYYKKHEVTELDYNFLSSLPSRNETIVIYADICMLSEGELEKYGIVFKKIPCDITRI